MHTPFIVSPFYWFNGSYSAVIAVFFYLIFPQNQTLNYFDGA